MAKTPFKLSTKAMQRKYTYLKRDLSINGWRKCFKLTSKIGKKSTTMVKENLEF